MKVHLTSFGIPRDARRASQDAFEARQWGETVIAVMADGVGGARAGGEASRHAVETLVRNYAERPRSWTPQKSLQEFTRLLNQRLYQDSLLRFGQPELVSTLAVAVIEGDHLFGLNIGDSRVYLAHEGEMEQISRDHVLGFDPGSRHILSRAIGLEAEVEPHYFERTLSDGDVALLCTDGLTNVFDEVTLRDRLQQRSPARSLVTAARAQAPQELLDDTSAIVLEIVETGRLRVLDEQPLRIPDRLDRGDVIDGFALAKPFQQSDRVWLATRDAERFTLKFAPLDAREHEAVRHAFTTETWHATRLGPPFFPRAFVPPEASARYYAMEFIEAPSLKALLGSRPLSAEEAIALGRFLLSAGQRLLQRDLVHGDLKPENILVLSGYDSVEFKLVDFGSVTEIFSTTSRAGTASYLAPERFRESPISERTELFAIGVTLYEALTRKLPYGAIERFQTPQFHPATNPGELNRNLPPWLASVLLKAIAIDPTRRYGGYSEMLYDLEHPDAVQPFRLHGAPLLERNPLLFYQIATCFFLATTVALLLKLLLSR